MLHGPPRGGCALNRARSWAESATNLICRLRVWAEKSEAPQAYTYSTTYDLGRKYDTDDLAAQHYLRLASQAQLYRQGYTYSKAYALGRKRSCIVGVGTPVLGAALGASAR